MGDSSSEHDSESEPDADPVAEAESLQSDAVIGVVPTCIGLLCEMACDYSTTTPSSRSATT